MAQGVPMRYGPCHEGPWHNKHMAHHEDVFVVPMDRQTKKIDVGVRPGSLHHIYGQYEFKEGIWHWKPPVAASSRG